MCVGIAMAVVYAFVLGTAIFSRGVDVWWWLVFYATIFVAAAATPVARNLMRKGSAAPSPSRTDRRVAPPSGMPSAPQVHRNESEKQNERQVLEAIERRGEITPARAALETTLTVAEVDRILSDLATAGHLEVKVAGGQLVYSLG